MRSSVTLSEQEVKSAPEMSRKAERVTWENWDGQAVNITT